MDARTVVTLGVIALVVIAGFLLPYFVGNTENAARWRFVVSLIAVALIWLLLTPYGCNATS